MLVFFVRRTYDVEIARDLTAETFAQAYEHRRRFRGSTEGAAAAWLYGIARHQLSHYFRKGAVGRKAVERLGIQVPHVAEDDIQRIVELAGLSEIRREVAEAFAALSVDQRAALQLRIVDERAYPDVATALGVTEQTARARVSRGLQRLAEAVDTSTTTEVPS